jgi:hypothetical protein
MPTTGSLDPPGAYYGDGQFLIDVAEAQVPAAELLPIIEIPVDSLEYQTTQIWATEFSQAADYTGLNGFLQTNFGVTMVISDTGVPQFLDHNFNVIQTTDPLYGRILSSLSTALKPLLVQTFNLARESLAGAMMDAGIAARDAMDTGRDWIDFHDFELSFPPYVRGGSPHDEP